MDWSIKGKDVGVDPSSTGKANICLIGDPISRTRRTYVLMGTILADHQYRSKLKGKLQSLIKTNDN
mgnify:CR=1 FL=1